LYGIFENFCDSSNDRCKGTKKVGNDYCYLANKQANTIEEFFASFPSIFIRINNENIEWAPDKYFIQDKANPLKYCIGIDSQTYF